MTQAWLERYDIEPKQAATALGMEVEAGATRSNGSVMPSVNTSPVEVLVAMMHSSFTSRSSCSGRSGSWTRTCRSC